MYARVTRILLQSEKEQQAILAFDSVARAMTRQAGSLGCMMLLDQENSKMICISLWESETDLVLAETEGIVGKVLRGLPSYRTTAAQTERYEVVGLFDIPEFSVRNGSS